MTFLNDRARYLLRRPQLRAGLSLQDTLPELSEPSLWQRLQQAVERQVTLECEVFYPGLFRRHEIRAIPDEQGGLALLFQDVTDRQWTIEKDKEHAYLRTLFQDATIAISVLRGPKHEFEYSNAFARQLVGGRILEGLTVREAFPDLEGQGYFELLDQVYTTGVPYHGQDMPAVLTHPTTGQQRHLVVNNSYIPFRGFDAQVNGIVGITVDITRYVRSGQE